MKLPWKRPLLDDEQLQHFINTSTTILKRDMTSLFGVSHNGKRDLQKVYGYPDEGSLTYDYFYTQYQLNGVANRIVSMPARSCWRDGAELREDPEANDVLFADEMAALDRAGLFDALEECDILNRLGEYAVLYIGLPDTNDTALAIEKKGSESDLEDIYFAAYSQDSAVIAKYDTEITSPRYGLPETYTLTPTGITSGTTAADQRQSITAHWSRVVHMAEGSLGNKLTGIPALKPIINRVLDLEKTTGGAAEAFYRNAAQKLTFAVDKEYKISEDQFKAFQSDMEDFINQWKNAIGATGLKVNSLEVPMADPKPATEAAWSFIAAYTGVSRRIWTGEGSGQLTGNEDKASFNQLISDRQKQLCAGWLLTGLRAIEKAGLIKMPAKFVITWPLPTAMDEETESKVNLNNAKAAEARAGAIAAYVMAPGAESIIPPKEFLTTVMALEGEALDRLVAELGEMKGVGDGELEDGDE